MDDVLLELLQLLMMGIIVLLLMTVCFWLWIKKLRSKKYDLTKISLADIDKMSGHDFEDYLVVLFAALGFKDIYLTKKSRDFGADMIFYNQHLEKTVLQAKRYSDKLGLTAVQEVYAAQAFYEAKRGLIVTTSSRISDPCYQLALATQIGIIDRDGVEHIIKLLKKGKVEQARLFMEEAFVVEPYQYENSLEQLDTERHILKVGDYYYKR
ncbi:hypothetical protein AB990_04730 [Alkalihalobacillus pseudalcaliphilus]|nr:hypothetical protein AB990_04730 [Alkalihalobacillus pseudalcaliphilus]